MPHLPRPLLILALSALLAGCAAAKLPPAPVAEPAPPRQLQLLADPTLILAALPPDQAASTIAAPPAPADPAALATWGDPSGRWALAAQQASQLDGQGAASARAELEAFSATLDDGLTLATAARAQGHAVSNDAVLAELAWRLIAQDHPLRADAVRDEAEAAAWASYWRGEASAPGVVSGRILGAAIAEAAIAQRQLGAAGRSDGPGPGARR